MKLTAINTIFGVVPQGKTEGPAKPGDVFEVENEVEAEALVAGGFAKVKEESAGSSDAEAATEQAEHPAEATKAAGTKAKAKG